MKSIRFSPLFITGSLCILSVIFSCWGCSRQDDFYGRGYSRGYGSGAYESRQGMMSQLNLSDEQAKKIADIDSEYRSKYYNARGDFEKIESLRFEHRKKITGVLNDSQQKQFDQSYTGRWRRWGRRARHQHMGYYYGHGYGMGYGAGCFETRKFLADELKLSDEQVKKITDIDSKYRSLYYQNRGNFDKIDDLRNEHKKEIENVLNAEQKKKYSGIFNDCWMRGRGGPGWWGRHHRW